MSKAARISSADAVRSISGCPGAERRVKLICEGVSFFLVVAHIFEKSLIIVA